MDFPLASGQTAFFYYDRMGITKRGPDWEELLASGEVVDENGALVNDHEPVIEFWEDWDHCMRCIKNHIDGERTDEPLVTGIGWVGEHRKGYGGYWHFHIHNVESGPLRELSLLIRNAHSVGHLDPGSIYATIEWIFDKGEELGDYFPQFFRMRLWAHFNGFVDRDGKARKAVASDH